VLVVGPFGIVALNFRSRRQTRPAPYVSFFRDIPCCRSSRWAPSSAGSLYLSGSRSSVAWSNATNLTDGLDGLAAVRGLRDRRLQPHLVLAVPAACAAEALSPRRWRLLRRRDPMDLTIIAASFVGALVGFLWWNAPKAKIFMGDVGSMAIGGVIAALAILTRTELLSSSSRRLHHRRVGDPAARLLQAHRRQAPVPA
jgi:phospho-N-acetylmuramoyl-pentapeptide-transferase